MVEDFVAVVKGGTSESITGLVAKKLPTPELMRLWGDGVHYNPDFISSTVGHPLHLLFPLMHLSFICYILARFFSSFLTCHSECFKFYLIYYSAPLQYLVHSLHP